MASDDLGGIVAADEAVLVPFVDLVYGLHVLVTRAGRVVAERMHRRMSKTIVRKNGNEVVTIVLHLRTSLASQALVWYESRESIGLPEQGLDCSQKRPLAVAPAGVFAFAPRFPENLKIYGLIKSIQHNSEKSILHDVYCIARIH